MPFCPAGIFGAHRAKNFRTFVAAIADVLWCATLGDENSAQSLRPLPLLFVLCL